MKNITLTLFSLFLVLSVFGQKQKVYSIVKQPQSIEWYKTQLDLWSVETNSNPKNAMAWQNAYTAMRMLKINKAGKTQEDLNAFISKMQKAIPNTFEYHYLTYYNGEVEGDKYDKLFHHIEKAYLLDSTRSEIYPDLVSYYLLKGNKKEYNRYSNIWFNSNSISPNLLNFGYNMLASCADKSVLITNGDNDTYPLFLVQESLGFKPNVEVLNIYLLQKEDYRNRVFKKLNIPVFFFLYSDYKDAYDFMKAMATHLEKNLAIPLYYASTVNPGLYKASKEKVYITGLALKYSENKFDNMAILKKNVEQNFKLDYLTSNFYNDLSKQVVLNSNQAYLTGFLTLYRHYSDAGELQKKQWLENILKNIAETNPNKDYILKYIKEC